MQMLIMAGACPGRSTRSLPSERDLNFLLRRKLGSLLAGIAVVAALSGRPAHATKVALLLLFPASKPLVDWSQGELVVFKVHNPEDSRDFVECQHEPKKGSPRKSGCDDPTTLEGAWLWNTRRRGGQAASDCACL